MMCEIDKTRIDQILSSLRRGKTGDFVKPHKDVLLLSLVDVYEAGYVTGNAFELSQELEQCFERRWREFVPYLEYGNSLIEIPYFYLQGDGIWSLVLKDDKADEFQGYQRITRHRIHECVKYGMFSTEFFAFVEDDESRSYCVSKLKGNLHDLGVSVAKTFARENVRRFAIGGKMKNSFVAYLSTLHSSDANNKGALAESQAREPLFAELQVSHPWAGEMLERLTGDAGGHVILSGHAGDGKSTIAIEILRKLHGLSEGAPLPNGLQRIETVESDGVKVTIVKDLSECTPVERKQIFSALISNVHRYLIISNTGTLLDFFKAHASDLGKSSVEIEDLVLTALDSTTCRPLELGANFSVFNLAQCDNVDLALKFLTKMVSSLKWEACAACPFARGCPILANRTVVLRHLDTVLDRIGLLYYRAYAYGERLTMRQVGAHFAYMITAGLDCSQVAQLAEDSALKPDGAYSFVNRFWGDDGFSVDASSLQMKAIRVFAAQPMNEKFAPTLERRFWESVDKTFDLGIPEVAVESSGMLKKSKRTGDGQVLRRAAFARRNWRRYMYFFYEPPASDVELSSDFGKFLSSFLGSPMAVRFRSWQRDPKAFSAKVLQTALFAVLQEEFCGYRPIDGGSHAGDLFITLRQKSAAVVQSAQLVLCKVNFSDAFVLKMQGESVKMPTLIGVEDLDGISLTLDLPFLDYMMVRRNGGLSQGLNASYRTRLEKLMSQIVSAKRGRQTDVLQILKKGEDGVLDVVKVRLSEDEKNLEVL